MQSHGRLDNVSFKRQLKFYIEYSRIVRKIMNPEKRTGILLDYVSKNR